MIILASQSEIRAKILQNAGVEFEAISALVDEDMIKFSLLAERTKPRDIADALAEAKARKVSMKVANQLVLGCDQLLVFEGQIVNKSKSPDELYETLKLLRGNKHKLYSAAVIAKDGQPIWRFIGEVQIMMRDYSDEFLQDYVYQNFSKVCHSVGGYQIEGIGAQLIEDYRGDYFSILGLPLLKILSYLRDRELLKS